MSIELKEKLENAVEKKNAEKEFAGFDEGLTKRVVPKQKIEPLHTRQSDEHVGGSQNMEGVAPKEEVHAEVHRIMAEVGGYHPTRGKPYPEWMENVQFPKKYRRPDIPTFDGSGPAMQHQWHFSMRTGGLLENDA